MTNISIKLTNLSEIMKNSNTETNTETNTEIENYIDQLTDVEKQILNTAYKMLGSSFDISKSIGFLEWKK